MRERERVRERRDGGREIILMVKFMPILEERDECKCSLSTAVKFSRDFNIQIKTAENSAEIKTRLSSRLRRIIHTHTHTHTDTHTHTHTYMHSYTLTLSLLPSSWMK